MAQQGPLSIVKSEPLSITKSEPLPTTQAPPAQEPYQGGTGAFAKAFWDKINPLEMVKALNQGVFHPVDTVKGLGEAQGALFDKARAAADKGDYVTASRHLMHYMIPLLGPQLDDAADDMVEGRYAEGLGKSVGLGTGMAIPGALKNTRLRTPALKPNAAEAEAIAFAEKTAIPVDAGTATGSRFVRGVERMSEHTLGGNVVAQRARQAQEARLATVGEQLAAKGYPSAVTAEQAGQGVRDAALSQVRKHAGDADTAYEAIRQVEADPASIRRVQTGVIRDPGSGRSTPIMEDVPLPVDLRGVKSVLAPIYQRLLRQMPVTQQQASPGMKALENIVNGPDAAPLSLVDADLSAIKNIARADTPELRSVSQGIAANAVKQLDAVVRKTALDAGVLDKLEAGRRATTAKYVAGDIYEQIRAEPVRAFAQTTAPKDSAIAQLRDIAKVAPDELPKIGRALLESFMQKATSEGGFQHSARLFADWQKIGQQTKLMLFKDPAYVKDLDNFFLFAKKAAENPNPSGSGYIASMTGQMGMIWAEPLSGSAIQLLPAVLSRALWDPRAVKLLTRGLVIPLGNKAAATAATGQLMRWAQESGVPLTVEQPGNPQQIAR